MHKLSLNTSPAHVTTPDSAVDAPTQMSDTMSSSVNQTHSTVQEATMPKPSKAPLVVLAIVAILAGVATGFGANKLSASRSGSEAPGPEPMQQVAGNNIKNGDVFGSTAEVFKDSAEGYLEAGGLDGEGSHKLLRPGGDSQTVYLTSSVTDLDKLVGMDVKIWGETFKGQKAGWLMDVGKIEVVNTQGTMPSEE